MRSQLKDFEVTIKKTVTIARQKHWWSKTCEDAVTETYKVANVKAHNREEAEAIAKNFIEFSKALNLMCFAPGADSVKLEVVPFVADQIKKTETAQKKSTKNKKTTFKEKKNKEKTTK